jgi:predicted dinucleotide-binding enzyme
MRIGIIGAGNIGSALTRRLTELGHDVAVANSRAPETLRELAEETGAQAVTAQEAARGRDLVVVTIPQARIPDLPEGLFADAGETVVVDTGNYYPRERDGRIAAIEEGLTESRWVQDQLGHPVIKAFKSPRNSGERGESRYAQHLQDNGKSKGSPGRIALPIAGDDAAAKAKVVALVDAIGFDPVDAGGLDESWRQQPGSPVYTADTDADGVRRALGEASPERTEAFRATPDSPGTFTDPR